MDDPDLQDLERLVASRFPVYESRYDPLEGVAVFLVTVDAARLADDFQQLKDELDDRDLIPMLRQEGGEHILYVVEAPEREYTKPWVNWALLLATIATTIMAGAILFQGYDSPGGGSLVDAFLSPSNLTQGALMFAAPLMLILGIHELGHYYLAKRHGVETSLPFFIPVPPVGFIIGTLGAFISIRKPITDRKALLDIGIAGPLAGLVVAIPVVLAGAYLTTLNPVTVPPDPTGTFTLGGPAFGILSGPHIEGLLFTFLTSPFAVPENAFIHPMAFAGWVGLLVTGLNLLPAGQLDGGHIFRAFLGEHHKYMSMAAIGLLLFFGLEFTGWLIFGLLVIVLGTYHPPPLNDLTPLSPGRKALAVLALVILVLTFVPVPFTPVGG